LLDTKNHGGAGEQTVIKLKIKKEILCMKVKMFSKLISPKLNFFSAKPKEPLDCGLEEEINKWLSQMGNIKIHQLEQSMCGGSWAPGKLIVTLLYED
jgi:hypothetical protein